MKSVTLWRSTRSRTISQRAAQDQRECRTGQTSRPRGPSPASQTRSAITEDRKKNQKKRNPRLFGIGQQAEGDARIVGMNEIQQTRNHHME